MTTTSGPAFASASDTEQEERSGIEVIATFGTVFLRTQFGMDYLTPASIVVRLLILFLPLLAIVPSGDGRFPFPQTPLYAAALLTVLTLGSAGLFGAIGQIWSLILVGWAVWSTFRPVFATTWRDNESTVVWTFLVFGVVSLVISLAQFVHSCRRKTTPRFACGRSAAFWMRVPSPLRPWRSDWHVQQYVEPLLVGTVGFVLLIVYRNWFGVVPLVVAACISLSAASRREFARKRHVSALSVARRADAFSTEVKTPTGTGLEGSLSDEASVDKTASPM